MCRRPITLFELLIVMVLASLVTGAVVINVRKLILQQQFRTDVALIVDKLRLAQDLMLIYGTDLQLHIAGREPVESWIEFKEAPQEGWKKLLQKKLPLKSLRVVLWKTPLGDEQRLPISVRFFSKGSVMDSGLLSFEDMSGEKATICLPGFPHFIQSSIGKSGDDPACDWASQQSSEQALTQYTVAELQEMMRRHEVEEEETPSP